MLEWRHYLRNPIRLHGLIIKHRENFFFIIIFFSQDRELNVGSMSQGPASAMLLKAGHAALGWSLVAQRSYRIRENRSRVSKAEMRHTYRQPCDLVSLPVF